MNIIKAEKPDYNEIIAVWEASVRATHDFLSEEDIVFYRSVINNEMLDSVDLFFIKDRYNKIIAFTGLGNDKIEMLFIHPDYRGTGLGKILLNYAIDNFNIVKVDVNEQNEQAVGFYIKSGFIVTGRNEVDGSGRPFPILEMMLGSYRKSE